MPFATDGAQQISDHRRFQLLVEAVADYAIYMLDPGGVVMSWNTGARRITGYPPAEIVGQNFSQFFTDDDRESRLPEKILAEARAVGRHESEGWRVRKDGGRFWTDEIVQAVRDDQEALIGFVSITRDMTDRAAAHAALEDSERRFRILVDGVVDYAIYLLDPSGVITNWNAGAQRLKGYTSDEIVGQHFSKFYTKEDRAAGVPGRVLEAAAREGRFESEGWRVRKDGSRFWASAVVDAIRNEAGVLEGFAKVTRDITERQAAHEALRESERQFRLLVAGVTDYALFMLAPNGIVTSWNVGAHRIKGYTAEEIIGQHFSCFYTESDRSAGRPARALETARQVGRFEAEGWRVRKDGSMFWANAVIDAIRDERGELVGFAKITRDITERREAEMALQQAQAQRAQAQKMDALGQLTGGVSHDFNNLLAVVSGYIQIIKAKVDGDPKAERAAEAIELAVRRGESLTRQLLTFSRRQTVNPTVVQIGKTIEGLRSMLASAIGQTVELVVAIETGVWPVKVDPNELDLALVNALLNARDATADGGTISVTAGNVTLSPRDTDANIEGDFVAIRVADTGKGIAPDVLPRVFDPFFTTKQTGSGSGLGLSQVHGFAHQSGGTVVIDSELGRGTTVTLYLPRTNEAAGEKQSETETETESAGSGTVLVVEDNPEVAGVTVLMLEELGYEAHAVADAGDALDVIGRRTFDLIISDIVMPGPMDGLGLAETVRERKPKLPVLLVTGYSHPQRKSGADFPILRKPIHLADLSRTAARMIAQARQPPTANVVPLRDTRPGAGSGNRGC